MVYVGSYLADSLLIKLHHAPWRNFNQPTLEIPLDIAAVPLDTFTRPVTQEGVVIDAKGNYIEILEEYPNLAPMEDAVLVDLAGSGQVCFIPHLPATGSIPFFFLVPDCYLFWRGLRREHKGCWTRSQPTRNTDCVYHRRGLGFPTSTDLPREVTPLLNRVPSRSLKMICRSDTHIVVSTPQETHLFRVDEDEERLWYMDPITVGGFVTDQPTLALANVMKRVPGMSGAAAYGDSSFVIQVTPKGISVLEMDRELGTTSSVGSLILQETTIWKEKRVVATSINASQVVIALDGGVIASFTLDEYGHLQIRQ